MLSDISVSTIDGGTDTTIAPSGNLSDSLVVSAPVVSDSGSGNVAPEPAPAPTPTTMVIQDPLLVSAQPNTVLCADGYQDVANGIAAPCIGHGGIATTTVATPVTAMPVQDTTQPIVAQPTPEPITIPQPMPAPTPTSPVVVQTAAAPAPTTAPSQSVDTLLQNTNTAVPTTVSSGTPSTMPVSNTTTVTQDTGTQTAAQPVAAPSQSVDTLLKNTNTAVPNATAPKATVSKTTKAQTINPLLIGLGIVVVVLIAGKLMKRD